MEKRGRGDESRASRKEARNERVREWRLLYVHSVFLTFKVYVAVTVQVDVPQDVLQISVSDLQTAKSFKDAVDYWKTQRLLRQLRTCWPRSFFMASLSSAVLIWPSPLVSNCMLLKDKDQVETETCKRLEYCRTHNQ